MVIKTLTLIVSVFGISTADAQGINATPAGGDSDIVISARVIGCGDGIVQTGLGEQCDGLDLNGQTCSTVGLSSGDLSCRNSCIFETSLCSGSGSSGGGIRNIYSYVPETNIIFTGTSNPGDIILILNNQEYFTYGVVDENGIFSITVPDPDVDDYGFTFFSLSEEYGVSVAQEFNISLDANMTTQINNIDLFYPKDTSFSLKSSFEKELLPGDVEEIIEELSPLFDVFATNIIDEKSTASTVPYVATIFVGFVLLGVGRFIWWLINFNRTKYIDFYDITR